MGVNEDLGSILDTNYTINEIRHQPSLWQKIWDQIFAERKEIESFLDSAIAKSDSIILTGAGTSAFIGLTIQSVFRKKFLKIAEPISTTDIVSHPDDFLIKENGLLMISFARSGNSPESSAAVELASDHCNHVSHLVITCNENGQLAKDCKDKDNTYVVVLPVEANDQSLAMTSSFSGMMLAAILIGRIDEIAKLKSEVDSLCEYGEYSISQLNYIGQIAKENFKRGLFLGSGPLYGIAKEAQLKMQELTDGQIICKYDSYLGLRHGPKAVINNETLVTYHLSNNPHAKKYDRDLIETLSTDTKPKGIFAIGENIDKSYNVDWVVNFQSKNGTSIDEDFLAIASIVPAQILAFCKSVEFGLDPDNPSRNGTISRVVKGVSIYNI